MSAQIESTRQAETRGAQAAVADIAAGKVFESVLPRMQSCFDRKAFETMVCLKVVVSGAPGEAGSRTEEVHKSQAQERIDEFTGYIALLAQVLDDLAAQGLIKADLNP